MMADNVSAKRYDEVLVALGYADTIFINGKVVAVDSAFAIKEAVPIRGDRFLAVGSSDAIAHLAGVAGHSNPAKKLSMAKQCSSSQSALKADNVMKRCLMHEPK